MEEEKNQAGEKGEGMSSIGRHKIVWILRRRKTVNKKILDPYNDA